MSLRFEVVETRRERRAFVELARRFRGSWPSYVPQLTGETLRLLDPVKNPVFRTARQRLWVAKDAGVRPRGRVAATFDPRHELSLGEPAGWVGFFHADGPATAPAPRVGARRRPRPPPAPTTSP